MSASTVYEQLHASIVNGEMHPNEQLVESDLILRFGASRSAVRIAILRLEQEGLVEHERNRSAKVRLVSESEAIEIYEARALLEGLAARKAAARVAAADIDELTGLIAEIRERLDLQDLRGASDLNAQLHTAIMRVGGHATAARLVTSLNSHLVRFQYRTIMIPGRPEHSFSEHSEIVAAIAAGDGAAAESAMRSHLEILMTTVGPSAPSHEL